MDRKRAAIMEKARTKRIRRQAIKREKASSHTAGGSADTPAILMEGVKNLTHDAIEKVEKLMTTTAQKLKAVVG